MLDNHVSWKEHLKYITNKVSKLAGILVKLKRTLHTDVLLKLYYAYIHSYMVNAIVVWGSAARSYLDPLFKLQKKCIKLISFVSYRTPSYPLFKKLNILPITELYNSRVAIFMFKIYHLKHPINICHLFNKNHGRLLRNNHHYVPPKFKCHIFEASVVVQGPYIYNSLVDKFNFDCSLHTFRKNIKKYYITTL